MNPTLEKISMNCSIIVAMNQKRIIGYQNKLPWHLPADLKHFKHTTMGKPIIMGRKTADSLPRALPGRTNVAISGNPNFSKPDFLVFASLEQALAQFAHEPELMIIGGATIYEQALPQVNTLYITEIEVETPGDAFFPEVALSEWEKTEETPGTLDEKNNLPHRFLTYRRKVTAG